MWIELATLGAQAVQQWWKLQPVGDLVAGFQQMRKHLDDGTYHQLLPLVEQLSRMAGVQLTLASMPTDGRCAAMACSMGLMGMQHFGPELINLAADAIARFSLTSPNSMSRVDCLHQTS